jgi:hypothetical protein
MSGNLYSGIKFNHPSSTMMSIKRFCIFLFSHQMKNTGPLKIQICSPVVPGENQRLLGACNRSPGSKLLSITTQLHCGSHLGGKARLPDTILEEDHPMTISSTFSSY